MSMKSSACKIRSAHLWRQRWTYDARAISGRLFRSCNRPHGEGMLSVRTMCSCRTDPVVRDTRNENMGAGRLFAKL